MRNLIKQFKKLFSNLPKAPKTKIDKSKLDRGYNGVFTARRKRSDMVIVPFISFVNIWYKNLDVLSDIYKNGYRVLCTPSEYFTNLESLNNVPVIVRYKTYEELEKYPTDVDWDKVKTDRRDYSELEVIWIQDIKNLDKHGNKGKSKYIGPKHIGQHEMDYSSDEEILNVQMCLLFQMINCIDFKDEMLGHPLYNEYLKFSEEFKSSDLFLNNPNLQEFTTKYGFTVCPILIKFPLCKDDAIIKFKDIIDGRLNGDLGREEFNRTTTKVNLHHISRLISGKLNHNHKNVFLGTATGNSIDAAMSLIGKDVSTLR